MVQPPWESRDVFLMRVDLTSNSELNSHSLSEDMCKNVDGSTGTGLGPPVSQWDLCHCVK